MKKLQTKQNKKYKMNNSKEKTKKKKKMLKPMWMSVPYENEKLYARTVCHILWRSIPNICKNSRLTTTPSPFGEDS